MHPTAGKLREGKEAEGKDLGPDRAFKTGAPNACLVSRDPASQGAHWTTLSAGQSTGEDRALVTPPQEVAAVVTGLCRNAEATRSHPWAQWRRWGHG